MMLPCARRIVVVAAAAVLVATGVQGAAASDVLVGTSDNWDSIVGSAPLAMVEFYAPWCGHCKSLAPVYEEVATALKVNDPPVPIVKVDATMEAALSSRYGVTGYPTIKIFRHGAESGSYDGARTKDAMVSFVAKQAGPAVREMPDATAVLAWLVSLDHEAAVVGVFPTPGSDAETLLTQTADRERDNYKFAITRDPEAAAALGIEANKISVIRPPKMQNRLEPAHVEFEGSSVDALREFLPAACTGLAGVYNSANEGKYAQLTAKKPLPLFMVYGVFDWLRDAKTSQYWRNRVMKVATDFQGRAHFAVARKSERASDLARYMIQDKEIGVGLDYRGKKYGMDDDFSVDALTAFVERVLAGKEESKIKSEAPPAQQEKGATVVTGRTFEEIVTDAQADVLIEFYAPWCGHCKKLAPVYDQVAEGFKNDAGVVIAKIDATANDYPPTYDVKGYPTLYWLPKSTKTPVQYTGQREEKDFLDWIKSRRTTPAVAKEEL